jgi:hypothetical protein
MDDAGKGCRAAPKASDGGSTVVGPVAKGLEIGPQCLRAGYAPGRGDASVAGVNLGVSRRPQALRSSIWALAGARKRCGRQSGR